MPSEAPRSAESQNQHYLTLLHEHTAGDPTVFEELREDGSITVNDTYNTSEYLQLGAKRRESIEKENSIVSGLDGLQLPPTSWIEDLWWQVLRCLQPQSKYQHHRTTCVLASLVVGHGLFCPVLDCA